MDRCWNGNHKTQIIGRDYEVYFITTEQKMGFEHKYGFNIKAAGNSGYKKWRILL